MYCNMKKSILLSLLWGVLVMTLVECKSHGAHKDTSGTKASASNRFSPFVTDLTLDVLRSLINSTAEIRNTSQNIIFSPSSLYKTVMMLYLGSTGGSKTKMGEALHIESVKFDITESFQKWRSLKPSQVGEYERLFYHKAFEMTEGIKKILGEDLVPVDTEGPVPSGDITDWATQIMPEGETLITQAKVRGQKLLPVSLAYSKPDLQSSFPQLVTNTLSFSSYDEINITVAAIEILSRLKHYKSEVLGSTIFSIKYEGSQFTLLIFLPDETQSISGLSDLLTVDRLNGVLRNLTEDTIVLQVPQFTLQQVLHLKGVCGLLGMCDLLKQQTKDLKSFTEDPGLYVTEFLQKVEFKVRAERREQQPTPQYGNAQVFTVDRPFLYMVYDQSSKMPVLAGTIMNPQQL